MQRVLSHALERLDRGQVQEWGEVRKVWMNHIFFDGKLPKFLGFDYGPISIEGNRATVVQGAIYRSHGRLTTFVPSYRYIADLSKSQVHTSLAGGPSDRRFSPWYKSGLSTWLKHSYKVLSAERQQ